jgi:hypothetical protein
MQPYIKQGEKVSIDRVCSNTLNRHGLLHSKKKAMLGKEFVIDRIRDDETVVINRWHFHPLDLHPPYSEPKPQVKRKDYTPVHFNVEDIIC